LLDETEHYLRWVQETAWQGMDAGLTPLQTAHEVGRDAYPGLRDAERLAPNLTRAFAEESGSPLGERMDVARLFQEMVAFHGGLPACHA
jgi:cyclase